MAPNDEDLRKVGRDLANMAAHSGVCPDTIRSGRFEVRLIPEVGGGFDAFAAAAQSLAAMHGTGVTPTH